MANKKTIKLASAYAQNQSQHWLSPNDRTAYIAGASAIREEILQSIGTKIKNLQDKIDYAEKEPFKGNVYGIDEWQAKINVLRELKLEINEWK